MKEEKEITDYKLKPEYKGNKNVHSAIASIILSENKFPLQGGSVDLNCSGQEHSINKLKEVGVLDLWFEPIYKEEEKLLTIGDKKVALEKVSFDVKITVTRGTVAEETGTLSQLEDIYKFITKEHKVYRFGTSALRSVKYDISEVQHWNTFWHDIKPTKVSIGYFTWDLKELEEIIKAAKEL